MSLLASKPTARDEARFTVDLAVARKAIATERAGLAALEDALDAGLTQALDLIAAIKGRLIVSGMGKSGHIARKMAATFASTGTPAQFVHPAEASHGDLGMIRAGDAVLALSNSGETAEMTDLVAYTRRFRIPLIAMTARADSALGAAADVVLKLPQAEEACAVGLAPTTSTTIMLALGDALAVATMARRGFTADAFRDFHPRGSLGKRLAKVSDLMHADPPVVRAGTRMSDAVLEITAKRFGCTAVVDDAGDLLGIVTDGDLRRHMGGDLLARPVEAVMTKDPLRVAPGTLAVEALATMNARQITALLVCEGAKPVGIVHIHDLLREGVA